MRLLPFESLNKMTFGVVNADDGDERPVVVQFSQDPLVCAEIRERVGRAMVTAAMRELGENKEWSYPDPDSMKVGNLD